MQQPQLIEVGGIVLGTTVLTDRCHHFIALDIRVEPLDRSDWVRLSDLHRVARHLYLTGRLPERAARPAAASSLAASFCY
jgi:hypothetical protein